MGNNQKWLPVLDQDLCTGCASCLDNCEGKCIEVVDGVLVLQNAGGCLSDGKCIEACQLGALEMKWVPASGDAGVGKWQAAA